MNYLVVLLYLVSFAMFIYGLMGLTGPKTAVRGNWIAAAGMARTLEMTCFAPDVGSYSTDTGLTSDHLPAVVGTPITGMLCAGTLSSP